MGKAFKGIRCPNCGKKGLQYIKRYHEYSSSRIITDYTKIECRWCTTYWEYDAISSYLTQENTVGFNDIQLACLNNWIHNRMQDAEEIDPHYLDIEKATCKRALDFYQEILCDAEIEYDE